MRFQRPRAFLHAKYAFVLDVCVSFSVNSEYGVYIVSGSSQSIYSVPQSSRFSLDLVLFNSHFSSFDRRWSLGDCVADHICQFSGYFNQHEL